MSENRYVKEWIIIDKGPGYYYVQVNSEDTNGVLDTLRTPHKRMPVKWYWDDLAGWKDSTTTDSVRHQFIALQVDQATPWVIQAKDEDGLVHGGMFQVYADSVPPKPDIVNELTIGDDSVIIRWKKYDAKDGPDSTLFEILIGPYDNTPSTTKVKKAGGLFEKSGDLYTFKIERKDASFSYSVVAEDRRGSRTQGDIRNYTP